QVTAWVLLWRKAQGSGRLVKLSKPSENGSRIKRVGAGPMCFLTAIPKPNSDRMRGFAFVARAPSRATAIRVTTIRVITIRVTTMGSRETSLTKQQSLTATAIITAPITTMCLASSTTGDAVGPAVAAVTMAAMVAAM